ncbi:MAG: hypothetical protein NWR33_02705 [Ilumatobacteraceae bacterium]|jgi:hypothetical protein|nr:MAG: hypothetical protein ABR58_02930 [Acidimicrobium sp. BACL19 MAG-120924-bin39]MDP4834719.1 hypothetical protein [Ilumatobacteraceae bacterium]
MNLARDQIIVERRYIAVFATISDQSLGALAQALPEALRDPFARAVGLRRGAFDEADTLAANVRTGMVARKAIIDAGVLLSEPCTEYFVDTLGDASDDPSFEDLQAVIPAAIDKFTLDAVRLMAVQYSAALGGFRRLVTEDDRFKIPAGEVAMPVQANAAEQAAKRAARRERRQQKR